MATSNHVFSVFSFLCFFLLLFPFYWRIKEISRNVAVVALIAWTALGCLNAGINSILWNGTAVDKAPIWCEISIRINIAVGIAIPACSLAIQRALYGAIVTSVPTPDTQHRLRSRLVELFICIGIPLLEVPLAYVVQGHRYNIFEDIGCVPAFYNVVWFYVLVLVPQLAIALVAAGYGIITMRGLLRRRRALQFLTSDQEVLRRRQWDYLRLLGIASVDAVFAIPMTVYFMVMNIRSGLFPWISWADTHSNYSRVIMFPRIIWAATSASAAGTELNRWVIVTSALLFIMNFGPAADSRRHLKQMGSFVAGSFRRGNSRTASGSSDPMGSMEAASRNHARPVEISLDRRRYSESSVIDIQKTSLGSDPKGAI